MYPVWPAQIALTSHVSASPCGEKLTPFLCKVLLDPAVERGKWLLVSVERLLALQPLTIFPLGQMGDPP